MNVLYALILGIIVVMQLPFKLLLLIIQWVDGWFDYLYWEVVRLEHRLP
jgi:hypothetical protein